MYWSMSFPQNHAVCCLFVLSLLSSFLFIAKKNKVYVYQSVICKYMRVIKSKNKIKHQKQIIYFTTTKVFINSVMLCCISGIIL